MSSYKLKKGYDLRITGEAEATLETLPRPTQAFAAFSDLLRSPLHARRNSKGAKPPRGRGHDDETAPSQRGSKRGSRAVVGGPLRPTDRLSKKDKMRQFAAVEEDKENWPNKQAGVSGRRQGLAKGYARFVTSCSLASMARAGCTRCNSSSSFARVAKPDSFNLPLACRCAQITRPSPC